MPRCDLFYKPIVFIDEIKQSIAATKSAICGANVDDVDDVDDDASYRVSKEVSFAPLREKFSRLERGDFVVNTKTPHRISPQISTRRVEIALLDSNGNDPC